MGGDPNQPGARWEADIERRLSTLETASRIGLNRMRNSYATAAVDPTVFAAWESGAAGSTYADDQGNTGTGYGQVTVTTNTKVLVLFGCRVLLLGANGPGAFRSATARVGFGIDALTPDQLTAPTGQRTASNFNPSTVDNNVVHAVIRRGLTPGSHVFKAWAFWNNDQPAAPILPRMTDTFIAVLPID
jgi:hypothetical protein